MRFFIHYKHQNDASGKFGISGTGMAHGSGNDTHSGYQGIE